MNENIDVLILDHLKTNLADVLVTATDYIKDMGEMAKLKEAIANEDIDLLMELKEENERLVEAVIEADY